MRRRFEILVDQHGPRLLQLATIILRAGDEAEDVVQDCLVKLWHHLPELDDGCELPWLVTCTRNACLDRLRRNRHQAGVLRRLHAEITDTPLTSPDAAPELITDRKEDARRLQAAIAQMTEPGRSLLILRDIQDIDVATAARTLGLSQTQVKVYTFRARRKLRLMLEEYAHEHVA